MPAEPLVRLADYAECLRAVWCEEAHYHGLEPERLEIGRALWPYVEQLFATWCRARGLQRDGCLSASSFRDALHRLSALLLTLAWPLGVGTSHLLPLALRSASFWETLDHLTCDEPSEFPSWLELFMLPSGEGTALDLMHKVVEQREANPEELWLGLVWSLWAVWLAKLIAEKLFEAFRILTDDRDEPASSLEEILAALEGRLVYLPERGKPN